MKEELREELIEKLRRRAFASFSPFGEALSYSLEHARIDPEGWWLWEELDYCDPPLAQERKAVLDRYFDIDRITQVEQGEGWARIEQYPPAFPGASP
jgi:hypothetical protein